MVNTKNRNSGSNNEPEYGSRHSRNRSADASGNSVHGARGAAGTRARRTPHGVESDGLDTRAAAPARGISHEEKRRRQNRRDIFSSLGILLLIALLGFAVIQPTALPALTRSLFPEAADTVPNR